MTRRLLLLAPSRGASGIKRSAETLQAAFDQGSVACWRFDLCGQGAGAHRCMLAEVTLDLQENRRTTRLAVAHARHRHFPRGPSRTRLLNEAGLTERLGDAAARRAHRDHSYDRRIAVIVDKLA